MKTSKPNRKSRRTSGPAVTKLDPSHPNHDAILLKHSRLEAHRRRRQENTGTPAAAPAKPLQGGKVTKKGARLGRD